MKIFLAIQAVIALSALSLLGCGPQISSENSISQAATSAETRASFPPIIMYHEIRTGKIFNTFDVKLSAFEAQLDWLQKQGYRTLSLEEVEKAVTSRRLASLGKAVVLAFDDGYRGNVDVAAPALRKRGMKASFFVHLNALNGKDNPENYPQVNWEEARRLDADPLFAVYSHTVSHPDLRALSENDLALELRLSKETLEKELGGKRRYVAYPMGHYDARVLKAVKNAGYTLGFAVNDRGLQGEAARFSIPRIYMGTVMDDLSFFAHCVKDYRSMDATCFAERWKPL